MDIAYRSFDDPKEMYAYLLDGLDRILEEAPAPGSALANISALIRLLVPKLNWAGFYLLENGELILGPFQGKPAVSRIPVGSGVCGTAVKEQATQLVQDVHACANHIACDLNSRSEIVIPIFVDGEVYGVLDIDSPEKGRFTEVDREGLTRAVRRLAGWLSGR